MTMQADYRNITTAGLHLAALLILTAGCCTPSFAQDDAPDEAFLLFIANLEKQDDQWISPVDFADTPPETTTTLDTDEERNHD